MQQLSSTLAPFLYPTLLNSPPQTTWRTLFRAQRYLRCPRLFRCSRNVHSSANGSAGDARISASERHNSHLNPTADDYSRTIFQDKCTITVQAGSGGNGCVSFLREKYVSDGPANGGDGGTGGNVLIQAVEGQTSLHKLARRGVIKAGRGKNGKGQGQGGQRGADVLLQVPVGTVVREIGRYDPVWEADQQFRALVKEVGTKEAKKQTSSQKERWVLYPGSQPSDYLLTEFPWVPTRRPDIAALQPRQPIYLDLSTPMSEPILLAAGAVGGLGNTHFVSQTCPKPKFATTGLKGMRLELELELKLLADVGLVGLPNAGKSTLLRSITNSRTRIGNWAFTTLSPNIGTVVLDNNKGRRLVEPTPGCPPRTRFTIADIPGLIEGAHLDKGLGLGFLRHIDRAGILAFVIDLSAGDAVQALKALWHELNQYQILRERDLDINAEMGLEPWSPDEYDSDEPRVIIANDIDDDEGEPAAITRPYRKPNARDADIYNMYTKPWFVIGTKADLPHTQENFLALRAYLADVQNGVVEHPSRQEHAWRKKIFSVPVSAINAEGVSVIPEMVVRLLDGSY
ncbi:hypothetical protein VTO42DRAFT_2559 [Malbranchea cinnamomea]